MNSEMNSGDFSLRFMNDSKAYAHAPLTIAQQNQRLAIYLVKSTLEISIALECRSPDLIEFILQVKYILHPFQSKGQCLCTSNSTRLSLSFPIPIFIIANNVDSPIANLYPHGRSVNLLPSPRNRFFECFSKTWGPSGHHAEQAIKPA